MPGTALILGQSGKIGSHAADAFWNAGWTVRRYRRGTDMIAASMGADVIVNGLNPPNYHDWARQIPAITAEVIAAARASGATVILPGNVYNYGAIPGTWDEDTPQRPVSRKGLIRKEMEEAYAASGVQTIILRAGNFIDPDRNGDVMSLFILKDIGKDRVTRGGNPNVRQAYAYVPDWARAAVALAEKRADLASFEDVPFPGHTFTTRELTDHLEGVLNRPLRLSAFPWWIMTLAAPVWELARELREMRYLQETDHALSGDKFARLLPDFVATPQAVVMEAGLPPDVRPDQAVRPGRSAILAGE